MGSGLYIYRNAHGDVESCKIKGTSSQKEVDIYLTLSVYARKNSHWFNLTVNITFVGKS